MNDKKRNRLPLNRAQILEKCKQMEKEIQNVGSGNKSSTLQSIKTKKPIDPDIESSIRHQEVVAKVKDWIGPKKPGKPKSNLTQQNANFPSLMLPKEPESLTIVGPKRAGTGISEIIKNSEKKTGPKNFLKEFGDFKAPKSTHEESILSWAVEPRKTWNPDLKPAAPTLKTKKPKTPEKAECAPEVVEEPQKLAEDDADKVKRIMAKEKRMKLKKARMEWEKDNEIKERPQKPKGSFGDMFFVPVPENKRKPEEFKDNYSKYICKFEQKFREKLSQKINNPENKESDYSGYTSDPSQQRNNSIKDAYYELFKETTKKSLLDKLKTDLRI